MNAIDDAFLAQVLARVSGLPGAAHDALAQDLRAAFPGCHISVCGEDDIPARLKPATGNNVADLYYVASGEHCLTLTNDAAAATGIVVALRDNDD